jgi:hypothetical protein
MWRFVLASAVCGLSLFSTAPASAQNLIANGSFEQPHLTADQPLKIEYVGSTFHGWTVTGPSNPPGLGVSLINENYTENFGGNILHFSPAKGAQSLDLSGPSNEGPVGVQQTVATTAGEPYVLSFSLANQDDAYALYSRPSAVEVYIDGVSQGIFKNDQNTANDLTWRKHKLNFTAATGATTIQFVNRTKPDDNECGLDSVSVVPAAAAEN